MTDFHDCLMTAQDVFLRLSSPEKEKCSYMFAVLTGCLPNITRNAIVNCSELVTYDIMKELILKYNLMTGKCKSF